MSNGYDTLDDTIDKLRQRIVALESERDRLKAELRYFACACGWIEQKPEGGTNKVNMICPSCGASKYLRETTVNEYATKLREGLRQVLDASAELNAHPYEREAYGVWLNARKEAAALLKEGK